MNFTTFENLLQLIAGLTGIVTLIVMLFSIKSNKLVNFFFVLLIALVSLRMLTRSTFALGLQGSLNDFSGPYKSFILITIPLFYLYFKAIVYDNSKILKHDFIHLLFPILLFAFNLLCIKTQLIDINQLRLFNLIICSFFAFLYLLKSIMLLRINLWKKQLKIHIGHYKLIKNWTLFLASICVVLTLRLVLSMLHEWSKGSELTGHSMLIIQVTFWLTIFLKILVSPEILFGLPKIGKKIHAFAVSEISVSNFWNSDAFEIANEQDKKLKDKVDTRILILIEEIEYLAQKMNYFRNQKITLANMANELSVPISHIVYIFKYHCNLTFTEYKTFIKIEDSKKLIESGFLGTNTLESLAIEVGFSSYNPFFTAFKKLTGLSPNEYSISIIAKGK